MVIPALDALLEPFPGLGLSSLPCPPHLCHLSSHQPPPNHSSCSLTALYILFPWDVQWTRVPLGWLRECQCLPCPCESLRHLVLSLACSSPTALQPHWPPGQTSVHLFAQVCPLRCWVRPSGRNCHPLPHCLRIHRTFSLVPLGRASASGLPSLEKLTSK